MFKGCDGFGSFDRAEKRFNTMWRSTAAIIVTIIVLIISFWLVAALCIFNVTKDVKQRGLKNIVEEVWNGKEAK